MKQFLEVDVVDTQGDVIISPGLKVRHKDSQFEYTVDSVTKDGEAVNVVLKMPEAPRVEPQQIEPEVLDSTGAPADRSMVYELDPDAIYFEPEEEDTGDLLVVSQEEFESEYEVK